VNLSPGRLALGAAGLALGVFGVLALRDATLSTHEPVPRNAVTEVTLRAQTSGGESNQSLPEMVEALLGACRLEVASDVMGPIEPLDQGFFRATLAPALDETNRRQFRGCIEDWTIDHLKVDQVSMGNKGTGVAEP
jgi:hypothetical protein